MTKIFNVGLIFLVCVMTFTGCFSGSQTSSSSGGSSSSDTNSTGTNTEPFDKDIKNNSLAVSPDGKTAVVSNSDSTEVLVYDLSSKSLKKVYNNFVTPRHIAYNKDGTKFYISDSSLGSIFEYDANTLSETQAFEMEKGVFGFVVSRVNNKIYANNQDKNNVTILNLDDKKIESKIEGFSQPRQGIVMSPDNKKLYVTNFKGNDVRVLDIESQKIDKTIQGIPSVRQISISKDSKYLYGASSSEDAIYVIDIETGKEYKKISVGKEPYGAALSPDGNIILSGEKASNQISVISVNDDYKITKTITGLDEPRQAIVYDPNNKEQAFVLNKDLSISIINFVSGTIVGTIKK